MKIKKIILSDYRKTFYSDKSSWNKIFYKNFTYDKQIKLIKMWAYTSLSSFLVKSKVYYLFNKIKVQSFCQNVCFF